MVTNKPRGRPIGITPYHELIRKHGLKESELSKWFGYKSHGNLLSSTGRERFRAYTEKLIRAIEQSIKAKLN